MARASLETLLNDILKKIGQKTTVSGVEKTGAEIYRLLNSNIETHTMTIDAKQIIAQVTDEMYHREGLGKHSRGRGATTQKTATGGGQSVLGSGTRKADAKKELDKVIKDQVPGLCRYFYDKVKALVKKTTGTYKATLIDGTNPKNFSFSIAQRTKDKPGDVFKYIKGSIKQEAQKDLITALNKWAEDYSQRDTSKEMSRKTDKKYLGREATDAETAAGISYVGNEKIIQVRKGFGPGDTIADLGHMEGSSVSEKRQQEMAGEVEEFEGKQGELINLDEANRKKTQEFLAAFKGGITWTVGKYEDIGKLEDTTKIEFEAPYLNSNVAQKGEDIGLERYLLKMVDKLKDSDEWANFEGSDSMFQKIDKTVKNALVKEIKRSRNIKRRNLEHRKIKRSKGKATRKINAKVAIGSIVAIKTKDKTKTRASFRKRASKGKSVRKQATAAAMPLELIGLINKELPDTVRANMGEPALTNVTGRFADSTRATDMHMTPQGFPSIGYTYQRNPYGTFEQDHDYDPRRLIDRSMREIAAQYAIGRFYTRRV
jgi:hypothetical protein